MFAPCTWPWRSPSRMYVVVKASKIAGGVDRGSSSTIPAGTPPRALDHDELTELRRSSARDGERVVAAAVCGNDDEHPYRDFCGRLVYRPDAGSDRLGLIASRNRHDHLVVSHTVFTVDSLSQ